MKGTSAGDQRAARELDLALEGAEIQLHVHQPGGTQQRFWVGRDALQAALDRWAEAAGRIDVAGRTARKEAAVVLVFRGAEEVEVQAGWWIWVGRAELKAALARLGVRAPW